MQKLGVAAETSNLTLPPLFTPGGLMYGRSFTRRNIQECVWNHYFETCSETGSTADSVRGSATPPPLSSTGTSVSFTYKASNLDPGDESKSLTPSQPVPLKVRASPLSTTGKRGRNPDSQQLEDSPLKSAFPAKLPRLSSGPASLAEVRDGFKKRRASDGSHSYGNWAEWKAEGFDPHTDEEQSKMQQPSMTKQRHDSDGGGKTSFKGLGRGDQPVPLEPLVVKTPSTPPLAGSLAARQTTPLPAAFPDGSENETLARIWKSEMLNDVAICRILTRLVSLRPIKSFTVDSLAIDKPLALLFHQRLQKPRTLLVPLHLPKSAHWILLVLQTPGKTSILYDSLPHLASDELGARLNTVEHGLLAGLGWNLEGAKRVEWPHQQNGVDCGVSLLVSAVYTLAGRPSPGNECDYTLWRKVLAALFVSDDELSLWRDQHPEHLTLQPLELRDDPTIVFHTSFASPNPLPRIITASRYFEWRDAILKQITSSTRLMTDSLNEFLHRYRAAHRSIAEIIAVLSDLLGKEPPEILEEYQKVAATLEALKACNDSYEDIEQMLRLRLTAHEGAIKEQSLTRNRLEELLAQYRSDLCRLEDVMKRVEQDLERA
ncbi:ulp1 protease family [Fusarium albosuccineum]|uniref:Ulp1 protease family n=1 Tax=Fusarium albosuccineum TaxID=1237068 RepID=A0A8H4L7J2_9HYPO|nr:ulp1 protease family [Fusarium albosuccineum]